MPGKDVVKLIRDKRPGALYNKAFADYIEAQLPGPVDAVLSVADAPATALLKAITDPSSSSPARQPATDTTLR
jgi:hypothetical protein